MDKTNETEPEKKSTQGDIPVKALDWVAYGSAAAVGAVQGRDSVREAIYEQYKDKFPEIRTRVLERNNLLKKIREVNESTPQKLPKELARVQKEFEEDVARIFEEQYKMKGVSGYWSALTGTNKGKVFERVFTTGGIVLGALLTVANLGSIRHFFSGNHQKSDVGR
jgi:hypothetical protein